MHLFCCTFLLLWTLPSVVLNSGLFSQVHLVGSGGLPQDLRELVNKNPDHMVCHDWLSNADLATLYGKASVSGKGGLEDM